MGKIPKTYGEFSTGLKFLKLGDVPNAAGEAIIMMHGGPGNDLPSGLLLNTFMPFCQPLIATRAVYFITRKSGLTQDYTLERMADDVAAVIASDLGGSVHGIIGLSYGGMILPIIAAKYPEMAKKFIVLSSAHKISELGKQIDLDFARLMSEGKHGKAMARILDAIYPPSVGRALLKGLMRVMGIFPEKHNSETYDSDILIEATIETTQSPEPFLSQILPRVYIFAGDSDFYFPAEFLDECAELIPNSTLKLYHGKGHSAIGDKEVQRDIVECLLQPS